MFNLEWKEAFGFSHRPSLIKSLFTLWTQVFRIGRRETCKESYENPIQATADCRRKNMRGNANQVDEGVANIVQPEMRRLIYTKLKLASEGLGSVESIR